MSNVVWMKGSKMAIASMAFVVPALVTFGFAEPSPIRFEATRLPFRFDNGSRKRHDLPEIMGGGVGLIDFDGDGKLDVYLCQGGPIVADPGHPDPPCRLFRNDGKGAFTDVTETANAPGPSYAMGVSVGDFDGDGKPDLFVTGWRGQRLYRNLGNGTFHDVTEKAGLNSDRWGTSSAFADIDGDGRLDLYVACYVSYAAESAPYVFAPDGKPDYPGPEDFTAQPDHLYRNNGDGTFTDVANESGILQGDGRGLGVIADDFNGDGKLDLFVAEDGTSCRLLLNRGGWKFEEVAQASGVAFDGKGEALAGMGVACGDIDGDGLADLIVTNFFGRSTLLFHNEGNIRYSDASQVSGLSNATRKSLGFGIAAADFDGDGQLDLLQANGHVLDRARLGEPFEQTPILLRNGGGRFVDGSKSAGPAFAKAVLGRGLAVGDLDDDGRPDAVLASLDAEPVVLWNRTEAAVGLILDLVGKQGENPPGTTIKATICGKPCVREIFGGGSYLSASDRRVHLGLAGALLVDRVEIRWPSGRVETWNNLRPGKPIKLVEGSGTTRPIEK